MILSGTDPTFQKKADVVSCFIQNDLNEILLLHRQLSKSSGGKWGLPAGKVELGETLGDAIIREIFEETGCKFTAPELTYLDTVNVRHGSGKEVFDFGYHAYRINLDNTPAITINDAEHQAYMWVSLDEALEMDLVEDQGDVQEMFTALLK